MLCMLNVNYMQSGLYMEPTVITDVYDNMWVAHEESFGPIMVISRFKDGLVT